MLQHADVTAGVTCFQDANCRPYIDPVCRLVTGAEAVILRVARSNAEEDIVSRKELDITAQAELVCASGKAEQPCMTVDLGKVFASVGGLNSDGACPVRIQWHTDACSAVGQGRCGTREESLDLCVVNPLRNFPALKTISHVRSNALGEVVFQKEGIGRPLLAEEIIAIIHNQISRGAGIVLRTRCRCKRRRARGRREHVGIG